MKTNNDSHNSNPNTTETNNTPNTQDHAARTWDEAELERVLVELWKEADEAPGAFCQLSLKRALDMETPLPPQDLAELLHHLVVGKGQEMQWVQAMLSRGWDKRRIQDIARRACFQYPDYDRKPSTSEEMVKALLLNERLHSPGSDLYQLFAEDPAVYVEFVKAAAVTMPEEVQKNLPLLLRFMSRKLKTNETLDDPDAEAFVKWGIFPWLDFRQREDIRWTIVKHMTRIHDTEGFFKLFSKEQRFSAGKNLSRILPNVQFAARMLLEYCYWEREPQAQPFLEIIERAMYVKDERRNDTLASRAPDVYRECLTAGERKGEANRWRVSQFDRWLRSLIEYTGWFFGTLEVHESPSNARRVNLQVKAPANLRVHGFPPTLVLSLPAARYDGRVEYHSEPDHQGRSLTLQAGDEVMVRRDFHKSEVVHRTHDTAIFRGRPTCRMWWPEDPWKTNVMIPVAR